MFPSGGGFSRNFVSMPSRKMFLEITNAFVRDAPPVPFPGRNSSTQVPRTLDLCRITPRLQFAPQQVWTGPPKCERISHCRLSCQDLPVSVQFEPDARMTSDGPPEVPSEESVSPGGLIIEGADYHRPEIRYLWQTDRYHIVSAAVSVRSLVSVPDVAVRTSRMPSCLRIKQPWHLPFHFSVGIRKF